MQSLETAIAQFVATLVPLDQLDAVTLEDKHTLLAAHTLAHTALIQLYRPFAQDDPMTFDKSSQAARACVSVIEHITDQDFGLVDPIIGVCLFTTRGHHCWLLIFPKPCWTCAADTLFAELETMEHSWPLIDTDVRNQITTILYAMTALSPRMPIVGEWPFLWPRFEVYNFFSCRGRQNPETACKNLMQICMSCMDLTITDSRTFYPDLDLISSKLSWLRTGLSVASVPDRTLDFALNLDFSIIFSMTLTLFTTPFHVGSWLWCRTCTDTYLSLDIYGYFLLRTPFYDIVNKSEHYRQNVFLRSLRTPVVYISPLVLIFYNMVQSAGHSFITAIRQSWPSVSLCIVLCPDVRVINIARDSVTHLVSQNFSTSRTAVSLLAEVYSKY